MPGLLVAGLLLAGNLPTRVPAASLPDPVRSLVSEYCLDCHDGAAAKGGYDLAQVLGGGMVEHAQDWERALRKMVARQMPPPGKPRPAEESGQRVVSLLGDALDRVAEAHPDPGRTETFRRLNRTEYQNAIRDLLGVEIDATALLPKDDASHGFDNVTVGDLSPTLLARYLSAAGRISRLAVGSPVDRPGGDTYRLPPDRTQEAQVEGLPPGTRGGVLLRHTFPRAGVYEIQVRLTRDRNEEVEGLREPHQVEVLIDRDLVAEFTVAPPRGDRNFEKVDAHLKARVRVAGGAHELGVTFLKDVTPLLETRRQPYLARYNMHRHPRRTPAVYQVSIEGPYESQEAGDTPSRRKVFTEYPSHPGEEDACASRILGSLVRRAYRRPITDADLERPLGFFRAARDRQGFEAGVESALAGILASPEFLFRIERDPVGLGPGRVHLLRDVELASRLSFFLWSSIPDEELLGLAEKGELHRPGVLAAQARRMLADPRAGSLVTNFAAQWLHLRNLEAFVPDLRLFPEFDDNLRQAFRRETEWHFETLMREDLDVRVLLRTGQTFLNERLAKHYGIPHVYGSHFRRVELAPDSGRGGLLRQGSILTVTSYATRTSPVLRGNWILANLLGTPAPPPPPNVPTLKQNTVSESLPMRQRLAAHRADTACAGCHDLMDPVGFCLESFDATGRWRVLEDGQPVDSRGGLPDGSRCDGIAGLEEGLLQRPDLLVGTLTGKLLTFALGRGLEPADAPAVRRIVREAEAQGNRFSSLIVGIVQSVPFTMRKTP